MNFIENEVKLVRQEFGDKILPAKRSKLDKYANILKEMKKQPFYKKCEETGEVELLLPSIRDEIFSLRRSIESDANEVNEEDMLEAVLFGHDWIKKLVAFQEEIIAAVGKEKKEYEKARTYYNAALQISPNSDVVNYNCAVLFVEMKDYQPAIAHLKRALLHHSEFKAGQDLLNKIEEFIATGQKNDEMGAEALEVSQENEKLAK